MTAPDADTVAAFRPAVRAAAGWWVQRITDPERKDHATPETAAAFAAALEAAAIERLAADAERVEKMAAETGRRPYGASLALSVDYSPHDFLAAAAAAAGIHQLCFPIKTNVLVRQDHVVASWGYGAPYRLVWAAEDWDRPPCDHMKPEDGWQRFADWNASPDLMKCGHPRYHDGDHGDWIPDPSRCARCGQPESAHYTRAARDVPDRCAYKDAEPG